jgi:hypothetical protein
MEVKSKVVNHKPGEQITPDLGHTKYIDWMADDTERDPTPANKRREEQVKATRPKAGSDLGFSGRMAGLDKGPLKQ